MCEDCGCQEPVVGHDHGHVHTHSHSHDHNGTGHNHSKIDLNLDVMSKNNHFAEANRKKFSELGLYVLNIISSPGSGKTTLLEALARRLGQKMAVIEGDIQTRRDAERVIRAGSRAIQIETQGACHLDAHSIGHALEKIDLTQVKLLVIENVGNLVCPSTYDLGEHEKIALLTPPEGDDKILKYPALFSRITALLINKIDVLEYFDFSVENAVNECKSLNNKFETFQVSAKTGTGIDEFIAYLEKKMVVS